MSNGLFCASDFCEKYKTKEIQNDLNRRGISRLCHMTQIDNLVEILTNKTGILADDFIEGEKLHRNDPDRLDGKTDFISMSIQFPNVWYYRYRKNSRSEMSDWAVIFVDTDICKRSNTLFSPVNAAKANGAYLGTGVSRLMDIFDETVAGRSRTEKMLSSCPTDDQAEIMIHYRIPVEYIKGIAFETMEVVNMFIELANRYSIEYPKLYLAPELFATSLSNKIRKGVIPSEILVKEESGLWQKDMCS